MTHSGPEVLFKTCVAMKFVDDDDDDDDTDIVNTTEIRPIYHAAPLVVKNLALSLKGLVLCATM